MQDVIEHLVVRYEPIPGGGAESADPEAIRTSLVNVQIVEIVYVRALADIPKITDLLLNMLVPDSLRNISIKFRECTPDDVHRGLRDLRSQQFKTTATKYNTPVSQVCDIPCRHLR